MNLHDFDRARQVSDLNQLRSSTEKLDRTAEWLVERGLRLKYMRRQIHDIKTPLSAALLSLELVKRFQGNHEKEATLIERATKNVLRAVEMLTSLISEEEKLISSLAS